EQFLASEQHHPNFDVLGEDLDLSAYSSASLEALECLAPLNGLAATIGFEAISPEIAKVLSEWKTYFLCFPRLQCLEYESAFQLGNAEAAHGLDFGFPIQLSATATRAVVGNGAPMYMTLHAAPDLSRAVALATHEHEMFLTLPAQAISPMSASALSLHAGYLLQIAIPDRSTECVLQALASNAHKQLSLRPPDVLDKRPSSGVIQRNWVFTLQNTRYISSLE
ncbi:MAG: hypothetical protein K9K38_07365, partial [Rhodoferax sp.]|nr:hypothetical protein [Rhodoferax sp.]